MRPSQVFQSHRNAVRELGDILISTATAKREATRRAVELPEEITRLVVHGTLHAGTA